MCFIVCFWDFLIFFFFFWIFLGMTCTWENWALKFFWLINRVLETWFLGGCHVEKMPHQTWSDHGNRVFETLFIDQNRVFETRDVSKIDTFETVPTNYIVGKMGLIPNFGLLLAIYLSLFSLSFIIFVLSLWSLAKMLNGFSLPRIDGGWVFSLSSTYLLVMVVVLMAASNL